MSHLSKRKTRLQFETAATVQGRGICVEIKPYTVILREKRKRKGYEISWEAIFWQAAKIEAERARAERKLRRKNKYV